MKRWVNDYNIASKIYQGYRPTIPLEVKEVGQNVRAIQMEIPDADYKNNFENKQIINDIRSPNGGLDLTSFVAQEFHVKINSKTAGWFFKIFIRKLFNKYYVPDFNEKEKCPEFQD
jgi:hypothetical protein